MIFIPVNSHGALVHGIVGWAGIAALMAAVIWLAVRRYRKQGPAMSYDYRADLVSGTDPGRAIRREFFTARHDQAAARKAVRLLRPHVTDPAGQYADLYVRDHDGGTSAEFVDTISLVKGCVMMSCDHLHGPFGAGCPHCTPRRPYKPRITVGYTPAGDGIVLDLDEVSRLLRPRVQSICLRYGEIEARRNAGERADLLAAEYGVTPDVVAGLEGWPSPKRRLS